MAWKVFWDTPRGDGMLSSSFATKSVRSDMGRLFFVEGAVTIFTALVATLVLPDFPSTSHRWLPPIEARLAQKRMEEDAGVGDEGQTEVKGQGQILLDALTDWKVMYMALKYVTLHIPGARLTCPLHEVSSVSSSPTRLAFSSPPSLLRLVITQLLPSCSALHPGSL